MGSQACAVEDASNHVRSAWFDIARLHSCQGGCKPANALAATSQGKLGAVQELHEVFWEPKAAVLPSLETVLEGPPIKKLLFMTNAARIASTTLPHWQVG